MIIKQMYFNDEEFYELFEKSKTPYGDYDMSTIASNLNNLMSDRVQQELDKYKLVASGKITVETFDSQDHYSCGGNHIDYLIGDDYLRQNIEIYIKEIGKE